MKDIKGKHIVVIGAARSGAAAAMLLANHGAQVFVTEKHNINDELKLKFESAGIGYEENGHSDKAKEGEFAVLSPGVPTDTPIVQHFLKTGREVFSEIEAACWFNLSPVIAVTGSNGKTTVTKWLSHTWETAKRPHILAGNIGYAFSGLVSESSPDKDVILEVSSFQLDHIKEFKPYISLLLNITPDHLDRYQQSIKKYAASKFRITENQSDNDVFIYYYDDPLIQKHVEQLRRRENAPTLFAFSNKREVPEGAYISNENIILKINEEEEVLMPISEMGLHGNHNLNNGLATALAARASEIKSDVIRESLRTFEGVEHRLEEVRIVDGVKYINDSKATNINSVWYALDSFNVPMVLILGGRDKGNDYTELTDQLREKVHTIVAIGEAQEKIISQLNEVVPQMFMAETMKEAVKLGRKHAKRGEIVILSPACASFDMFENYEQRGNEFKKAVNDL